MAVNGEQLGAFLAEEFALLKQGTAAPVVNVQPPNVTVDAPVVNIPIDAIADAIRQSNMDVAGIISLLTQVMSVINGIELEGVQTAIKESSSDLAPIVDALNANTEAITASRETSASALVGIVSALGDAQAAQLSLSLIHI